MTCHDHITLDDIAHKDLVLATDLDGTFLGGTDDMRSRFYSWIDANRDSIGLIFVTGRDPGFIRSMCRSKGIPTPDFVVADVGTTIASVDDDHFLTPIDALESEIAELWADNSGRVEAALRTVSGLRRQDGAFRYRVSYHLDPTEFEPRALDIVAELGLDALVSDNRFFDVLPKGVSKGPSLLRLLSHLGIDNRRCLVAGDTPNDLSMLSLGLPAVAVGGSEPALLEEVASLDHVHVAEAVGAAGIAEAIVHFKMLEAA